LVNSNWNEHWHLDGETRDRAQVVKVAGRLAVDLSALSPRTYTVVLRYSPRAFVAGALVTALALPLCLWLFMRARRRRG
jgi:hypothetical protein